MDCPHHSALRCTRCDPYRVTLADGTGALRLTPVGDDIPQPTRRGHRIDASSGFCRPFPLETPSTYCGPDGDPLLETLMAFVHMTAERWVLAQLVRSLALIFRAL